eukprot:CAMPEP_0173284176 /NCGR_PEP_ID=MMETSP1143-20121109/7877_1 /TAXON_ID=483371 /ORGANISM="non described non described, Strain CCMP2298" /LENGTH=504 /DNA_ID=CAMNT_0014222123 /DNA_START=9 /DNA_END=1524 /DNA_ORIENTATION=-
MARRWVQKEEDALAEVRRRLKDQLAARPQYPDIVGDRRLLRFIRGKGWNVDEATRMISLFLKWRDDNDVDEIRRQIVHGGIDTPFKFPYGKVIIDLAPQIILSANSMDKKGRPLAFESFDFSPKEMMDSISIKDYLVFLTYSLEYRAIILEQLSHEREQKYLAECAPADRRNGYGEIILDYTIRDLKGVGFGHLGSKGRALVAAALDLGLPNYQEYLGKCAMVNVPWLFNTFWYFIKGFLDEDTIAKINMCGPNYLPVLLEDITFENIPECLGGGFKQYNEAFVFDTSEGGPLMEVLAHTHAGHVERHASAGSGQRQSDPLKLSAPRASNGNGNGSGSSTGSGNAVKNGNPFYKSGNTATAIWKAGTPDVPARVRAGSATVRFEFEGLPIQPMSDRVGIKRAQSVSSDVSDLTHASNSTISNLHRRGSETVEGESWVEAGSEEEDGPGHEGKGVEVEVEVRPKEDPWVVAEYKEFIDSLYKVLFDYPLYTAATILLKLSFCTSA